jgi:hypothetical protein
VTAAFTYRQSGTTGCEILDADGQVFAWTVDAGWAGLIVGLLNKAVPFQADHTKIMTMDKDEIKHLVQTLLKHRPDLLIVKTDSLQEKKTLVEILKNAGAKVIYYKTKE